MRGMVPGLDTPVPLLLQLPGILQDDDFTGRFASAFDDGLAPVLATLDSLSAYVDPWLSPPDFLDWLAGWVSVPVDDAWDVERKRAIVADAAVTHRRRGTVRGMVDALELALGAKVEVVEGGACGWSATPGADLPGEGGAVITVRIQASDPDAVDLARADALVEELKPAHVAHRCVAVASDGEPVLVSPREPRENGGKATAASAEHAPALVGGAEETEPAGSVPEDEPKEES